MANYYQLGLVAQQTNVLPERVRTMIEGARDFHVGSRRFYDVEVIGAASGTWLGTLADGIVAVMMDAVHVLLMVGGIILVLRALG